MTSSKLSILIVILVINQCFANQEITLRSPQPDLPVELVLSTQNHITEIAVTPESDIDIKIDGERKICYNDDTQTFKLLAVVDNGGDIILDGPEYDI
jgi:hypothetical protein